MLDRIVQIIILLIVAGIGYVFGWVGRDFKDKDEEQKGESS